MLRYARLISNKRSYYEVLGVSRTATTDEIKKAFNLKAQQFHPDRNDKPDAKDKFQEVFEAYKVLRDDRERKAYDQQGTQFQQQQQSWSGARRTSFYEDAKRASDFERQHREYDQQEQRRQQSSYYYYYEPNQSGRRVITINPFTSILFLILLLQFSRFLERQSVLDELESNPDTPPSVIKSRWRQPYVLAFMNPFTGQWERIPEGYDPPPIKELMEAYVPKKDWASLERKLPHSVTVGYVPQNLGKDARVLWSRNSRKVVQFS
jgi:curved DNA-binding protein CbpA